jgi:hypothetical protein
MWKLIIQAAKVAATALAGWAVSDFFNERQTSKQVGAKASGKTVVIGNWVKWVAIFAAVGVVFIIFEYFKNKKK